MTNKCCKTCKWWDFRSVAYKNGRIPSDKPARCLCQPERMTLPVSIRPAEIYIIRDKMRGDKGADCPCWDEKIE
jgi:hypothetical protein